MTLCPYCMNRTEEGPFCRHCGGDLSYKALVHQLPAGTILTDGAFRSYEIGAVKGQGGFGITYVAMDLRRKLRVAIKEFYPMQCAQRTGINVSPQPGAEQIFAGGQSNFLLEAKMLAALPPLDSVVQIMDYFEINGTAYIVMEYLDGVPLHQLVMQNGSIPARHLFSRLPPLMRSLQQLHAANIIHRDISPDNIMWMPDGTLKLLDFGSARHLEDGKSVSIQLKHGFAPVEQYRTKGQGPYTDIYALCATIYYCITGQVPPHAVERLETDLLKTPSQLGVPMERPWEEALMWGLTVQPKSRPQEMEVLLQRMFSGSFPNPEPFPESTSGAAEPAVGRTVEKPAEPKREPCPGQRIPESPVWLSLLTKLKNLPLGTKVIGGCAALLLVLVVVLASMLAGAGEDNTKDRDEPAEEVLRVQEVEIPEAPERTEPEPEPEAEEPAEPEVPAEPEILRTEDGLLYGVTEDGIAITGYEGEEEFLTLPEKLNGLPVTVIGAGAFAENSTLRSVMLPRSLAVIEEDAFVSCPALMLIGNDTVPMDVTCHADFRGCDALICVALGENSRWEGDLPYEVSLFMLGQETELGVLTGMTTDDQGVIYGLTDEDATLLLKVPAHVEELDLTNEVTETAVSYMDEKALYAADALQVLVLGQDMYFPYTLTEDIARLELKYDFDSLSYCWLQTCLACQEITLQRGSAAAEATLPDIELVRLARQRAKELAESYAIDRPDGSSWTTLLDDNGYDWTYGYHVVDGCSSNTTNLEAILADDLQDIAAVQTDEGGYYYTLGFGLHFTGEEYLVAWFNVN